jgi:hypothetical protein
MDGAHPLSETGKRAAERAERAELPATIRRVGFVNDINHLDVHCGSRFAPLGMVETGGNRRKLPAKTLREKLSAVLLSHPRGAPQEPIGVTLAEIAEIVT